MGGRGGSFGRGGRVVGGYMTFPDKASSGWTYHGDGMDTFNFFKNNSNYSELIDNMSWEERNQFRSWAGGHFMYGQQYEGWDGMSKDDQKLTRTYDKFLDQATLSQGVVVSRKSDAQLVLGKGEKQGSMALFQIAEGSIVTSKGSMSCGAASEGLTIGSSGKNVEYRIHIPAGTKGAGMWIGDTRINGWGPQQREFMTNRDVAFRVGKTTYNSGTYTVDLFFAGRMEHDYGKKGSSK